MRLSRTDSKPNQFLRYLVVISQKLSTNGTPRKLILLRRYLQTNSLPANLEIPSTNSYPVIEILFVCTAKDFDVLPQAIQYAVNATNAHPLGGVSLIIPAADFQLAQAIDVGQGVPLKILNEEDFLPADLIQLIRTVFQRRAGWVIQQLLKVEFVSASTSPAVLVCDADTFLLSQRFWFDSNERQILTPSWEWTQSYYVFLSKFGLTTIVPEYTFVSHHMLMQPKFLREARIFMGWKETSKIVEDLIASYDGAEVSPFCIEYELYAQYLYKNYPNKVLLSKWANVGINRREFLNSKSKFEHYASISVHDYL